MCSVSYIWTKFPFLGISRLKFLNDSEMMQFALATLQKSPEPDDLICGDTVTLDRKSLKTTKGNTSLVNSCSWKHYKSYRGRLQLLLLLFWWEGFRQQSIWRWWRDARSKCLRRRCRVWKDRAANEEEQFADWGSSRRKADEAHANRLRCCSLVLQIIEIRLKEWRSLDAKGDFWNDRTHPFWVELTQRQYCQSRNATDVCTWTANAYEFSGDRRFWLV